jgi:hypothetical protein
LGAVDRTESRSLTIVASPITLVHSPRKIHHLAFHDLWIDTTPKKTDLISRLFHRE